MTRFTTDPDPLSKASPLITVIDRPFLWRKDRRREFCYWTCWRELDTGKPASPELCLKFDDLAAIYRRQQALKELEGDDGD